MESTAFVRRVRSGTILLMVWALTLFAAALPRLALLKQLPVWVGWPCAVIACWLLRPRLVAARKALPLVAVTCLVLIVRSLLPIQTVLSLTEPQPQISGGLVILTICVSLLREVLCVVSFIYLGGLVATIAEPVDEQFNSLTERSEKHFRYFAIGWVISVLWSYAIVAFFLYTIFGKTENPLGILPTLVERAVLSAPAIIRIILSWNIVLILFEIWRNYRGDPNVELLDDD